MSRCFSVSILACTLFVPGVASATTWIIEPDGTGDAPTIQAGVNVAAAGDTLRLAAGTFVGAGNKNVFFSGKNLVVLSASGAAATVIDCEQSGRAFLYVLGETAASVLQEITMRNGNPGSAGGAVICTASSPRFIGCVFDRNTGVGPFTSGGGAVFASAGNPSFEDCTFTGNHNSSIEGVGGAISLSQGGNVTISGCTFENNDTSALGFAAGGAVFDWFGASVTISGCNFRGNSSRVGGAVALIQTMNATIASSTFTENTGDSGGALGVSAQNLVVSDCQFVRNEADQGAGAEVSFYPTEFLRCLFQDNTASHRGGAVASFQAIVRYTGCVFSKNDAGLGGAIVASESLVDIESCTFHANVAEEGSVVRTRENAIVDVTHSILAFNVGPVCSGGGADLACSDVFGNVGGDYVGCIAGQNGVDGNFSADPHFCGPDEKDYTIRLDSPCAPPGVTGCGLVGAGAPVCSPISVEGASWGEIKSRYRAR